MLSARPLTEPTPPPGPPREWRCAGCGRVIGLVAGEWVTVRQATQRGEREITARLPCSQRCACGRRNEWPQSSAAAG